jgi:hypothetical protein
MIPPKRSLRIHPARSVERCGADHPSSRLLCYHVYKVHADGYPGTVKNDLTQYVRAAGRCARISIASQGHSTSRPMTSSDFSIRERVCDFRSKTNLCTRQVRTGSIPTGNSPYQSRIEVSAVDREDPVSGNINDNSRVSTETLREATPMSRSAIPPAVSRGGPARSWGLYPDSHSVPGGQ